MNAKKRENYYQLIIEELRRILEDHGESKEEMVNLGNLSETDLSDRAVMDNIRMSLMQIETKRSIKLRHIYDALDKLMRRTYGKCEHCGKSIPESRLKILPFTPYCINCQEDLEKSSKYTTNPQRGYKPKMKVEGEEWDQWFGDNDE